MGAGYFRWTGQKAAVITHQPQSFQWFADLPGDLLGSQVIQELAGEENYDDMKQAVMEIVAAHFRPEFINRIDEIIVFGALTEDQLEDIARLMIRQLNRCRIIARFGIGVDNVDIEAATRANIVVTKVPDYCIDEVSTHAISLMLALNRRLMTMDHAVRRAATNFVPPNRSGASVADWSSVNHLRTRLITVAQRCDSP